MDDTPDRLLVARSELALDLCACAKDDGPASVSTTLLACPGVDQVHVDRYVTWALVTFDPARTSADDIVANLRRAGWPATATQVFDGPGTETG